MFGIKFCPGCFHPFRPGAMSDLTDRVLPLWEAFGADGLALESEVLACADDGMAALALAEAFLLRRLPDPDPRAELALDLGYFDQAHFSRVFKRVIGRTPMEYLRASDSC